MRASDEDLAFFQKLAEDVAPQLRLSFDPAHGILHYTMLHPEIPAFTVPLLSAMAHVHDEVRRQFCSRSPGSMPLRYVVLDSAHPSIWSLGGDLPLFAELAQTKDLEGLREYGRLAVGLVASNLRALSLPVVTVAIVNGDALGGGFEAVLTHDIIIAKRNALLGFPEIRFGSYPGMGGMRLLGRAVGLRAAAVMISQGAVFTAERFSEMTYGCSIDALAETDPMHHFHRLVRTVNFGALLSVHSLARKLSLSPATEEELNREVDAWAEHMLTLRERDLARMRLVIEKRMR